MKQVIAILIVLLLSSNAYWTYKLLDASVSLSYRDDQIKDMKQYQVGLEKFIVELARQKPMKKVVAAAKQSIGREPYKKENCIWVGQVGFKFNVVGKLTAVEPTWSFGADNECLKSSNNQINQDAQLNAGH